jgi:hypothetical protein
VDDQHLDRAERRRRARAEQKARRKLNHPKHGHDPEGVLLQLRRDATRLGIAELMSLSEADWDMLPEGSVVFARSVFAPDFSVDLNLKRLIRLVATVCQLWADSQADPDQAESIMLRRCGLSMTNEPAPVIEIASTKSFSESSMLIVNRVALIGELAPQRS